MERERLRTRRPGRFASTVVAIEGVLRNSPTHRRDTIVYRLDCGHRSSVLRLAGEQAGGLESHKRWIGTELQCAKCQVLERIQTKARVRGVARA